MELTILTQSSLATYRRCPRQYYYQYECRLSRDRSSRPLRFGSAFHLGLELRVTLGDEAAIDKATESYDIIPEWADSFDWAVERETLRALLAGYFWRYGEDQIEVIATEGQWQIPLMNPETGASSRTYALGGKIDKIIRLDDGRLAVQEYKTCGEDITDTSDYWPRLRCDAQISAYVYAARKRGHDVETVLYDVTRKPSIGPVQIPTLDENGLKIVVDGNGERVKNGSSSEPKQVPELDADGFKIVVDAGGNRIATGNGKWRQSGDTAKGYVVKTRFETEDEFAARKSTEVFTWRQSPDIERGFTLITTTETPENFGARLLQDIGTRPDFYFARREIPRMTTDLQEFEAEAWQQSQQLHQARRRGLWFRNVSPFTCRNCTYKDICLQNIPVEPTPVGFVVLPDSHPELTGEVI